VTLLEFPAAAAGTRVVAPHVLEGVAHRGLRFVVVMLAVRTVDVARGVVAVVVIMLTVRAVDVRLSHLAIP
jgi:hypothetical protein|tara:strand:+ start:91 stop:303 length:213 start_codon:yes stop_codon:yes gene_type:complete